MDSPLIFTVLTLVTGVAYPLVVTGIGKTLFPAEAAGSLIQRDGKLVALYPDRE